MSRRPVVALALAAWAAAAQYGCSSASTSPGPDDNGNPSSDGGVDDPGADGSVRSGGDDATVSLDDAGHPASNHDAAVSSDAEAERDAVAHDAAPTVASDAGGSETDASPDESQWLDPMNAARAATMAGEPPLTWNPIAAQVALNYAMQCNYAHNADRTSAYVALGGKGSVGENIAAGAPTLSIAGADSGWINEDADYDYATNVCGGGDPTIDCGHYTQIVWKTTTSVGCALVTCTKNSPFPAKYGTTWGFAVCDYTPAGNLVPQGQTTPERPY